MCQDQHLSNTSLILALVQQQIETPLPDILWLPQPTILLVNHHTSHHTDHLIDHHINRLLRDIHIINPQLNLLTEEDQIHKRQFENEPLKAKPRNIYNEIVDAQSNFSLPPSLPPSLPSKDSRYMIDEPNQPQLQQPALSQV